MKDVIIRRIHPLNEKYLVGGNEAENSDINPQSALVKDDVYMSAFSLTGAISLLSSGRVASELR